VKSKSVHILIWLLIAISLAGEALAHGGAGPPMPNEQQAVRLCFLGSAIALFASMIDLWRGKFTWHAFWICTGLIALSVPLTWLFTLYALVLYLATYIPSATTIWLFRRLWPHRECEKHAHPLPTRLRPTAAISALTSATLTVAGIVWLTSIVANVRIYWDRPPTHYLVSARHTDGQLDARDHWLPGAMIAVVRGRTDGRSDVFQRHTDASGRFDIPRGDEWGWLSTPPDTRVFVYYPGIAIKEWTTNKYRVQAAWAQMSRPSDPMQLPATGGDLAFFALADPLHRYENLARPIAAFHFHQHFQIHRRDSSADHVVCAHEGMPAFLLWAHVEARAIRAAYSAYAPKIWRASSGSSTPTQLELLQVQFEREQSVKTFQFATDCASPDALLIKAEQAYRSVTND
jgi:hypothetical protein